LIFTTVYTATLCNRPSDPPVAVQAKGMILK
jgi:hypothetical protein